MPAKNGMKKNILDKLGDLINMCCVWDKEWLELVCTRAITQKAKLEKLINHFDIKNFAFRGKTPTHICQE